MEQRVAIRQGLGEYALTLVKPARVPAEQPSMFNANVDAFSAAWEEGHLAQYSGESKRAHYFYHQALKAAPDDVEAGALADIFESLKEVNQTLTREQELLPDLRAAVMGNPDDSEDRFRYARLLWILGCEDEALKEYDAVLEHPETICRECLRDCWNNIGWALYRKEEYAKAIPWLERAAEVKSVGPTGELYESPLPFENIILVYAALRMVKEAVGATADYASRFGRAPWPVRSALRKLNIDADAIFAQQCGHAA